MTADSLALKYRPRTFAEITGQRPVQMVLFHMVYREQVPPALLLSGPRGCGKTSTARILGAALNCQVWRRKRAQAAALGDKRYPSVPCGACDSCAAVAAGISTDVIEIDAASNGTVAEIRSLRNGMRYQAAGLYRVVLLDEAHSMSRDAFNALLKELEEPQDNTVIVLLTTEPSRILGTVYSRCMPFDFQRIPVPDIEKRLASICQQEGLPADSALLHLIAERADGGLRDAIVLLDQAVRVGISTAAQFTALHGESDFAPGLVSAMADGDHGRVFSIAQAQLSRNGDHAAVVSKLVRCLRDVLALQAGGEIMAQGDVLEARKVLSARLEATRVAAAMRVLWDLRTKVRVPDAAGSLDLALAMCTERLHPPQAVPAHAHSNGHAQFSLVASTKASLESLGLVSR